MLRLSLISSVTLKFHFFMYSSIFTFCRYWEQKNLWKVIILSIIWSKVNWVSKTSSTPENHIKVLYKLCIFLLMICSTYPKLHFESFSFIPCWISQCLMISTLSHSSHTSSLTSSGRPIIQFVSSNNYLEFAWPSQVKGKDLYSDINFLEFTLSFRN